MSAQTVTILSGVLLLIVFALAGWNARRWLAPNRLREAPTRPRPAEPEPDGVSKTAEQ